VLILRLIVSTDMISPRFISVYPSRHIVLDNASGKSAANHPDCGLGN
jgi:hypothetical protein